MIENIIDGGFEDGNLSLYWNPTGGAVASNATTYNSTYSALLPQSGGTITQSFSSPIILSSIVTSGFWYKGNNVGIEATGSNNIYGWDIPNSDVWTYFDLKAWLLTLSNLGTLNSLKFYNDDTTDDYIDDVSLITSVYEPVDITQLINDNIEAQWSITNPNYSDIAWTYDEFDPRYPQLQCLLENFPQRKEWLYDTTYKVEHRVRITLFLKPIHYAETDIEAYKTTFYNAKVEIDRILAYIKYSIIGITNLELSESGWNDKNSLRVGRGTKDMGTFLESRGGKDVQVLFRSECTVTAIYYATQ
jgi:hypothetical protein